MTPINRVALIMSLSILTTAGVMHLDGAKNPTRRSPETWTVDDIRRLFDDPALHWCDRHHGHTGSRGPIWRCKGRHASVFVGIESFHVLEPEVEDLVIALLANPSADVSSRAAETLGTWGVARATPTLLRQGRRWHEGRHPERHLVVRCMLWAVERTASPDERTDLRSLGSSVPLGDLQSAVDHALTARSCGCPAPHRK